MRDSAGLFGIAGHRQAADLTYVALHAMQRRGEHTAGMVVSDGDVMRVVRGSGTVAEAFRGEHLAALRGTLALGQISRSPDRGDLGLSVPDAPVTLRYRGGRLAVAMVGGLANGAKLRAEAMAKGVGFATMLDSELIARLIAGSDKKTFVNRMVDALWAVDPAFCLAVCTEDLLVAVRGPVGIRPLMAGQIDGAPVISSDEAALRFIGAAGVRSVEPGEMVIMGRGRVQSVRPFPRRHAARCAMELVALAQPNSSAFGRAAYEVRYLLGQHLARRYPAAGADVVVAAGTDAEPAAAGFGSVSGVEVRSGLVAREHTGAIVEPPRGLEDFVGKLTHAVVPSVVTDRRVVLVANTLFTGQDLRLTVRRLRHAGATEVHVRVASPLPTAACIYGVAIPPASDRVDAADRPIAERLGADSVELVSARAVREAAGGGRWCDACLTGQYPVKQLDPPQLDLF